MKTLQILVLATLAFATSASAQASASPEPILGTWMVEVARSTYSPGVPPRIQIITWEPWQGAFKISTYGVSAAGVANYTEVITRIDGVDTPLEGVATPTTRAYRRAGRTAEGTVYEYAEKVNGRVTTTTRHTISPDGNTRTSVTTGTNANGAAVNNTRVSVRVR